MSSMVGSSPSDGINGRCGNRALMVGSSLGDFLFRTSGRTPSTVHECTPCPFVACDLVQDELLASRPSTYQPHRTLRVLVETRWSFSARSLSFQRGRLQSMYVILRQSLLVDSRTPSSASSTRVCPSDNNAHESSRILPRIPCYC